MNKRVKHIKKTHINWSKILVYGFVLMIILFLATYLILVLSAKFNDPTKQNSSHEYLLSKPMGDFEKTLVVIESGSDNDEKISEVYLFLTNQNKKESILIYVPGWIYFTGLEEDFGNSIALSSFRYAGDFLQEGRGVEYAIWQIGQMLGIKVDGYIWFTPKGMENYANMYGDFSGVEDKYREYFKTVDSDVITDSFYKLNMIASKYSSVDNMVHLSAMLKTQHVVFSNLSFNQYLSFWRDFNSQIAKTESYAMDLSYYRYSIEDLSRNGGQIRYLNTTEFDTVYRKLISKVIDRTLEKERARVEVYNGSGVIGAAKQFGRKIENAGCDVVRYENAPSTADRTVVYVSNKANYENSLEIVAEILSGSFDLVEGRPTFMTTGDIVVVLGKDIQQMYSF
jgi:hypothetical protein